MVEARYLHDFFAVQMVFLILVLYYSFSRTECPCPTYTGRECYDKDVHWNVCDFDIRVTAGVRRIPGRSGRRRGRARGTGRASATCPIPSGRSSSGIRGCSSCTAWLATRLARRCSWTRIRRGRCLPSGAPVLHRSADTLALLAQLVGIVQRCNMKPRSEMLLEVTVYCVKVRDQRGCLTATEH